MHDLLCTQRTVWKQTSKVSLGWPLASLSTRWGLTMCGNVQLWPRFPSWVTDFAVDCWTSLLWLNTKERYLRFSKIRLIYHSACTACIGTYHRLINTFRCLSSSVLTFTQKPAVGFTNFILFGTYTLQKMSNSRISHWSANYFCAFSTFFSASSCSMYASCSARFFGSEIC